MILAYIIVYIIEMFILMLYSDRMFLPKVEKRKKYIVYLVAYTVLFAISCLRNVYANNISFFMINAVILAFCYNIKPIYAGFHGIIITIVMSLTELIAIGAMNLWTANVVISEENTLSLWFLMIISKPVYFLILFFISLFFGVRKNNRFYNDKYFYILTLIPVFSLIIMLSMYKIIFDVDLPYNLERLIAFSAFLLLIINVFVYSIFYLNQSKNENIHKMELELQKDRDDREYYKMLYERDESQKIMLHDIKKHIASIDVLLAQNSVDEARAYINKLNGLKEIKDTIVFCENNALNLLLNRYMEIFSKDGIHFFVDVRRQNIDDIEYMDMTSLICNMLDNAYEASKCLDEPIVDLSINDKLIAMSNSCDKNSFSIFNGEFVTSKKNESLHGYGIKSMKRIVKKYNGMMELYYNEQDGRFHTVVQLDG